MVTLNKRWTLVASHGGSEWGLYAPKLTLRLRALIGFTGEKYSLKVWDETVQARWVSCGEFESLSEAKSIGRVMAQMRIPA